DEPHERRPGPGRELAVGEGAGASLAEEGVALGVVLAPLLPRRDVADALLDARASLEHDRAEALAREEPGGEEAARAAPDDDGRRAERRLPVRGPADEVRVLARRELVRRGARRALPERGLGRPHVEHAREGGDAPVDVPLLPRVERAPDDARLLDRVGRGPEEERDPLAEDGIF